jgi:hypothetical protein
MSTAHIAVLVRQSLTLCEYYNTSVLKLSSNMFAVHTLRYDTLYVDTTNYCRYTGSSSKVQ